MTAPGLRAWRFVTTFGVVSLLADALYEGARSITGPLLGMLWAAGALIGLVALPLVRRQPVSSSRGSADPR